LKTILSGKTSILVMIFITSLPLLQARESKQFSYSDWWDSGTGNYELSRVKSRTAAGDFDNDGKTDIAAMYDYLGKQAKIHVFKSNGSSFDQVEWWDSGKGNYEAVKLDNRLVAGDFDGDGNDDLAALYDYGQKQSKLHVFISNGTGFVQKEWWDSDKGKL
jgi:phage terminase large subunit-like protein